MGPHFPGVFGVPRRKEEIIEAVLAHHRVAPGETLFAGDAMTGYRAARNTEVLFVGRVVPSRPNPCPSGTAVIADMSGLAAYADGSNLSDEERSLNMTESNANKA